MKIKVLEIVAGDRFSFSPGDEVDVPDNIAKPLIKAGYAIQMGGKSAKKETGAKNMTKVEKRGK